MSSLLFSPILIFDEIVMQVLGEASLITLFETIRLLIPLALCLLGHFRSCLLHSFPPLRRSLVRSRGQALEPSFLPWLPGIPSFVPFVSALS